MSTFLTAAEIVWHLIEMNHVDTNILTVRNIIAFRPTEWQTHIQPNSAPAIDAIGNLKWKSSLEFISTMKEVSPIFQIQTGLSTFITGSEANMKKVLQSTVAGLGSIEYMSTSGLEKSINMLTYASGYIDSSSLYDCVNGLTQLEDITRYVGPMVKFIRSRGIVFEPRAYIQTENPGKYRIHTSTLGLQGSNLNNTPINNSGVTTSGIIDIGGYSNLIIPGVSKMRIDVNIGLEHTTTGKFSTFLLTADASAGSAASAEPIGVPVVVNYLTPQAAPIGKITYFLTAADFTSWNNNIFIGHRGDATNATTAIPLFGGIQVTLNNMD
jgi:hypothetical protein